MRKITLVILAAFAVNPLIAQTFVSTTPENRKVVLEEFTGINCQYCPDGHKLASQLAAANPGRVALINVHVGGFSTPAAGQLDFRTSFGGPLDAQANVEGYPAGTVNRNLFTSLNSAGTALNRGQWASAASQILAQSSPVNVAARATIDLVTRELTVVVEAYYTGNSNAATNTLSVALLQNNIAASQVGSALNTAAILPDGRYNHMHALRHLLTGQWGTTIGSTTAGSFHTSTHTYTIPASIRNIETVLHDLEVVVFVAEGNQNIITGSKAELTFLSPNDLDARPLALAVPEVVCGNQVGASVTIQNYGNLPLTSLEVWYQVNAAQVFTYNWTGNLATGQVATVSLPNVSFNNLEENTYWVATQNPNGLFDPISSNDILLVSFYPPKNSLSAVTITIVTDNYGTETTWSVKDPNGATVASGGPYTNSSQTYTANLTLADGCHQFIINDTYGDGICCDYGTGSYTIMSNGVNLYVGGDFTSQEVKLFDVNGVSGVEEQAEVLQLLSVFPNPFAMDATVRFNLAQQANVSLSVRNMLGQAVVEKAIGTLMAGTHDHRLTSDGLVNGIYLVSLLADGQLHTTRVIINR
jgi:hypothetical protein